MDWITLSESNPPATGWKSAVRIPESDDERGIDTRNIYDDHANSTGCR